ncbi:hypothetical protein [Clostridium sp. OS1-26]|uniref:hypothetical protein n=1 Tax=Clostridium sp. OS1-26 TaxID=3070681 RepID=UPI0027E006FD|nr:hypothetical protein [Clostridium sp. OS1-26]WML34467.1 hypothetical protein RCG18_24805 [Clostridium sp. OS1-26]
MNSNLERNVENTLDGLQEELTVKYNKSIMFILVFLNLLIPILSVEGLFSWCIGIGGSYKIINIYKNAEKNKTEQAIKVLIVLWAIAIAYNILVYYVTKIVVAKIV